MLVPSVLKEDMPGTKNQVLSEGNNIFFEQKYGIRQPKPSKQQRKRDKHERALRKVTQLKKNTRKELRTAKGGAGKKLESWLADRYHPRTGEGLLGVEIQR